MTRISGEFRREIHLVAAYRSERFTSGKSELSAGKDSG